MTEDEIQELRNALNEINLLVENLILFTDRCLYFKEGKVYDDYPNYKCKTLHSIKSIIKKALEND